MKILIKSGLFAICVGVACAATTIVTNNRTTAPYNPDQTHGNVRVVLVRVDRSTLFTDKGFRQTTNQAIHAVPGLKVVYVVEALGDKPVNIWQSGDCKPSSQTTELNQSIPEDLVPGGTTSISEYRFHDWNETALKPEVQNPKRAHVYEEWLRGVRVPNGKFDLHITTGFNEHKEDFVFRGIPVE